MRPLYRYTFGTRQFNFFGSKREQQGFFESFEFGGVCLL